MLNLRLQSVNPSGSDWVQSAWTVRVQIGPGLHEPFGFKDGSRSVGAQRRPPVTTTNDQAHPGGVPDETRPWNKPTITHLNPVNE